MGFDTRQCHEVASLGWGAAAPVPLFVENRVHSLIIKDLRTKAYSEYQLPADTSLVAAKATMKRVKDAGYYFHKPVLVVLEYRRNGREQVFYR